MPDGRVHRAVHEVTAPAPADVLYGLIADATRWPLFFRSCVHVEQLDFDGTRERLRMWAVAGDRITSCVSRRRLDAARRRVEFDQDLPVAPARSMRGAWTVEPLGSRSRVTLEYAFTAGDTPGEAAEVEERAGAGCRARLDELAQLAERWEHLDELVLSFEDTVRVKGPSELVFDFLYRVGDWPGELPHVRALEVVESAPGVQVVSMSSAGADGRVHRTESVRICFPGAGRILYKQTRTSPMLAAYTGEWSVEPDESGVNVTARHRVILGAKSIGRVRGDDTATAAAGKQVREMLGGAGLLVLRRAARHAAGSVRVL
ncbi:aromatase/cyclase [Dermacoccus nishinomiyaensis]|uniref:aromatase/cyclase n=1 Tax=Dermacoccus nishinomiyaensis TaxID=1274 RepID=UPI0033AE0A1C